jgi:hypothetical protein
MHTLAVSTVLLALPFVQNFAAVGGLLTVFAAAKLGSNFGLEKYHVYRTVDIELLMHVRRD